VTTEQNKAIVRGYMDEILSKGNLTAFDDYFSEEIVFNNSKLLRQQLAGMLGLMRNAFPDFHVSIEDQIAEGNKVVTRVTFRGTHQGEYMGIPSTGKQVTYTGIAIDQIIGGKVVEMWHESDDLGMLRQLGVALKMG
jgi:steroid delta-isomerase-like uncharacterized protein